MSARRPRWELYAEAVTHTSHATEHGGPHNERLEFMGDSVLQLCATELLFQRFPEATEGELSRMRRQVVNNAFLASVARERGLGALLRLGRGEEASGGRDRETMLSGMFEALLGAIFLDQGLDAARQVVRSIILPVLDALPGQRDEKNTLHEWVQKTYKTTPEYDFLDQIGPDHRPRFRVAILIEGERIAEGEGTSKQRATQDAAAQALQVLRARGQL